MNDTPMTDPAADTDTASDYDYDDNHAISEDSDAERKPDVLQFEDKAVETDDTEVIGADSILRTFPRREADRVAPQGCEINPAGAANDQERSCSSRSTTNSRH